MGKCISLNIGEWHSSISTDAWAYFTRNLNKTSVAFIYVPDQGHSGCTGMKDKIREKVFDNRTRLFKLWQSTPSSLGQNIDIAKRVTNMWFNPKRSKKFQSMQDLMSVA